MYEEALWLLQSRPIVEAGGQVHLEAAVGLELTGYYLDETRQVLPLHVLALAVEIEPHVANIFVAQVLIKSSKLVTDALLRTFFVDQVDAHLLAVEVLLLTEVHLGSMTRIIEVLGDAHWRRPFEVWLHGPHERNGASRLHITVYSLLALRMEHQDVLRFNEVGRVAIRVEASRNEPSAGTSAVLTRDQHKVGALAIRRRRRCHLDVAKNAGHTER